MLKRWCSTKEIEVCLLCEILISKDTPQGRKTVTSLPKCPMALLSFCFLDLDHYIFLRWVFNHVGPISHECS